MTQLVKMNHGVLTKTNICRALHCAFILSSLVLPLVAAAQNAQDNKSNEASDETLLKQYVESKGKSIISFDASNIKQYWIDKTVISRDRAVEILLAKNNQLYESLPMAIRLINVSEAQDCTVEVVSNNSDFNFSVLDSKSKALSKSSPEENYLQYSVASSTFHLEDTKDFFFYIKFNSTSSDAIILKKIIISFSKNKNSSYLSSPGVLNLTKDNAVLSQCQINENSSNSFSVKGKRSGIFSKNKILVTPNDTLTVSATVKNSGEEPTHIRFGFALYNKYKERITPINFPYKNQKTILEVVSSDDNSNTIIVNNYPEWTKNCCIAINVHEDMSDLPNRSILEGRVIEIKKTEDGRAEIILDKPIKNALKIGSKIRINGNSGSYFYTDEKVLQPKEETVFSSKTKMNGETLLYSTETFPFGTYYVVPLLFSYSVDSNKENTIQISDYKVSY